MILLLVQSRQFDGEDFRAASSPCQKGAALQDEVGLYQGENQLRKRLLGPGCCHIVSYYFSAQSKFNCYYCANALFSESELK